MAGRAQALLQDIANLLDKHTNHNGNTSEGDICTTITETEDAEPNSPPGVTMWRSVTTVGGVEKINELVNCPELTMAILGSVKSVVKALWIEDCVERAAEQGKIGG